MVEIIRQSPVQFDTRPIKTERQDDWEIVLQYDNEGKGPSIIDLSHVPRWDVQDADLNRLKSMDFNIPPIPGDCALSQGILISRLSQNQAIIYHLQDSSPPVLDDPAFTEVTDGSALLALIGQEALQILEKATALDVYSNLNNAPCILHGPIFHVPCRLVVLGEIGNSCAVIIACPRGYGKSMVEGLFKAGNPWQLHPAGKKLFFNWIDKFQESYLNSTS